MLKKILNSLLALTLFIGMCSFSISAKEENTLEYSEDELLSITNNYLTSYHAIEQDICSWEKIGYWQTIKRYEEDTFINWVIDISSSAVNQKPDKKRCTEILINLITLQEASLAERIEDQSCFDDLKTKGDYVGDVIEIANSFFGGSDSEVAQFVSSIIGTTSEFTNMNIENLEQAKYYKASIEDYARMDYFLSSIEKYAEIDELKEAAKDLRTVSENLFSERIEYFGNTAKSLGKFTGKFFRENMFYGLLKNTDKYKEGKPFKMIVDCAERAGKAISTLGAFTYKSLMLIGNFGFGTTNQFNRYQEMKVTADIAQSLVKSINEIEVLHEVSKENVGNIQKKCDYFDLL